ncbi:MAG: hypothetical protein GZ091_18175 [Paludibacter sp.]|nr:hypothetical protein [Paludibacter sp.]
MKKIKVAINGYGVIGKRVADAVALQDDMELVGVCDIITDWRIKIAVQREYPIFAFNDDFSSVTVIANALRLRNKKIKK